MFKPSKKLLANAFIVFLIFFSGCYIGVVYSNGSDPTWDELLGLFNVPWFNATVGINSPEYYQNGELFSGGVTDHGDLTGLGDDDHSLYLLQSGAEGLTGDLDVGDYDITANNFYTDYEFFRAGGNYTQWILDQISNIPDGNYTTVRKNTGSNIGTRTRLNLIEGDNITLTISDDPSNDEIDITITSTGGQGSGSSHGTPTDLNDVSFSGEVFTGTAGENLVFGSVVYIDGDGKYYKADCNSANTMYAIAIAVESISTDSSGLFLLNGYIRDDSWSAWTVGSENPLYVSSTTGEFNQTVPSGSGDQVQIIGYPIASKIIRFDPDSTVVEVG